MGVKIPDTERDVQGKLVYRKSKRNTNGTNQRTLQWREQWIIQAKGKDPHAMQPERSAKYCIGGSEAQRELREF